MHIPIKNKENMSQVVQNTTFVRFLFSFQMKNVLENSNIFARDKYKNMTSK